MGRRAVQTTADFTRRSATTDSRGDVRLASRPLEHPRRNPVGYRLASWPVGDVVGDQAPPIALLADAPAGEPALDNRVHLQASRVVAAGAMRLAREQRGEVHQHRDRRVDAAERLLDGLPVVADRLELTHRSIIRSKENIRANLNSTLSAARTRTAADSPTRSG